MNNKGSDNIMVAIYQIKTKPHGIQRYEHFTRKGEDGRGFVSIGYPGIGELMNVDRDEIRDRLAFTYPHYEGQTLGYHSGVVNTFANGMNEGDIVLITNELNNKVHVGQLGPYIYKQANDDMTVGMCHTRPVKWMKVLTTDVLNEDIQKLLRNRGILTQFYKEVSTSELEQLFNSNRSTDDDDSTSTAQRHDLIAKALELITDELYSEDRERQVQAAIEILRYYR